MMKKTFVIFMNKTGSPHGSGVEVTVQAETEFEAIQTAQQRHPNDKVASVKIRK